jgi:KaiC/GvpD/RAD55 family RecA-like ATPase
MYTLGGVFSDVEIEDGTNLLIAGPPMTGKYALALDFLGAGVRRGEGAIVVSTKDTAGRVSDDLAASAESVVGPVGVVDAVTKHQGTTPQVAEFVRYVSSPVDLTGIGIELSELLREFYHEQDVTENRILLHSLSTLLMYSDLQTVFRFLHVFTGRVHSADALGVFVIDDSAHDTQTLSTLKQLFDGVIEVEDADDGGRARLLGVGDDRVWRDL